MCLVSFSWKQRADYPLIVVANRDEFWDRPTARAGWWEDQPDIWGGRDLQAGGTWLAVHKGHGRFAWVTNYREPMEKNTSQPSRGELIPKFLLDTAPVSAFTSWIETHGKEYQGFNLVYGDMNELWYFSNRLDEAVAQKLEAGLYGLSNHLLETSWPKVVRAKEKLKRFSEEDVLNPEALLESLTNKEIVKDEEVPDTGIPFEMEKKLSPVFIDIPEARYGTRVSTVITLDKNQQISVWEKSWKDQSIKHMSQPFSQANKEIHQP
ncbi:MAG: NRDE family protein [Bacteroidota bacterium]